MYTSCLRQFHLKCNIYSITSKLTIDLTLNYVKIFKFQNGSTRKLTYKQSLSLNVRLWVLKNACILGSFIFFWKLKNEKWNSVFHHSSFYFWFSFSWEKNNVIFLHCNRNTRPNKIEADDSNCTGIYCIFISGLVSFPLWVQKKNENWPQIFIFHFSKKKKKFWHRFSFFIFLCSEKIKIGHRFSFVICHFSISIKIKIEHRFSFFIFQCLEKNENCKINCRFLFFIFRFKKKWKLNTDFHFSLFNLQKKWMTLIYTH